MQPIAYKAADGLTIHGYLTLPVGVTPKNLPLVLFVHGGPWGRDTWGYSGYVQWLANRGYAVLQPNFRSSTGYGKAFLNAGNRQWAGAMHQDLIDAKNLGGRAGLSPIQRRSRSWAAATAATRCSRGSRSRPTRSPAGVDIVGPSNLNTLLAVDSAVLVDDSRHVRAAHGRQRRLPRTRSRRSSRPMQIKAPLLIGQGANDPRVNERESDQIVAAMRKNNEPVEYVVFPDEGHGFARPENNKRFNAAVESFLGKYLGGRVEPATPDESVTSFEH